MCPPGRKAYKFLSRRSPLPGSPPKNIRYILGTTVLSQVVLSSGSHTRGRVTPIRLPSAATLRGYYYCCRRTPLLFVTISSFVLSSRS